MLLKFQLAIKGEAISEKAIYNILKEEGFSRLPRRSLSQKQSLERPKIQAAKSKMIDFEEEEFKNAAAGVLALLPYIERYGKHKAILQAGYPETKAIGSLNAVLCFIALKATDVARYSADDLWCMDRGI